MGQAESAAGRAWGSGIYCGECQPSASGRPLVCEDPEVLTHPGAWRSAAEEPQITSLVFIERLPQCRSKNTESDNASTKTPSLAPSRPSTISSTRSACYQTLSIVQAAGIGMLAVPPGRLDAEKLASFRSMLQQAGVDTSAWGVGGAKSVEHLFWETYQQRGCMILRLPGRHTAVKRITRLVKVRIIADIFGEDHVVTSRVQFLHDGQTLERKQLPLRKLVWNESSENVREEACASETCPYTEDWRAACAQALEERLGLAAEWQAAHLEEDPSLYTFRLEDNVTSSGYPGLNTLYCIHEIALRVKDPGHEDLHCLGLPQGQEFATAEGDFNFHMLQDDAGLPIGTQLNIWRWQSCETSLLLDGPSIHDFGAQQGGGSPSPISAGLASPDASPGMGLRSLDGDKSACRVPYPTERALAWDHAAASPRPPNATLVALLQKEQTDWSRVKKIARSIMQPQYSLKQFLADIEAAFPETQLHLLSPEAAGLGGEDSWQLTPRRRLSEKSQGDEYQRTVGAFFSIYWLCRMEVDGKDGMSYGVDAATKDWAVVKGGDGAEPEPDPRLAPAAERRRVFQKGAEWDDIKRLLFQAGIFRKPTPGCGRAACGLTIDVKRLTSLLALTAVHDIMKNSTLLPKVQAEHAPYRGYAAGDIICDHDSALAYVMEHFPDALPSYRGLDSEERRLVQFTQCKLSFNHGWFVQGEAPPGATLSSFRQALRFGYDGRQRKVAATAQDVAFYFVHWLTDLAGAEPTPLRGCEKFSIKFPLPVLNSFVRSFEFAEKVASETETEVMEKYLAMRWSESSVPHIGPVPTGHDAVARMRLLCMAQMQARSVLKGWELLDAEDKELLATEMARSGCEGQSFSASVVPKPVAEQAEGPAFVMYYGPAWLQLDGGTCVKKLSAMAEVYRCARKLWPATAEQAGHNVIVRIDMIKCRTVLQLDEGSSVWTLVKHNNQEAFVELSSHKKLNQMIANRQAVQVLDFSV